MVDDRLHKMFMAQFEAQVNTYGNNFPEMSDEERIEFIRWNVLAAEDELHEALGEVGWKPWATSKHINREAYVGELIDVWHFVMNLALAVGMTADEFAGRYEKKLARNVQRQQEGYDGLNKCTKCKRAYDDSGVMCTPADGKVTAYCAQTKTWFDPSTMGWRSDSTDAWNDLLSPSGGEKAMREVLHAVSSSDAVMETAQKALRKTMLTCPVCDNETLDRLTSSTGGDETAVVVHVDHDEYESPIGTRGGFVEIKFICPSCGSHPTLIIANHKGAELMGWTAR